ncbi:MAG: hypothetical protein IPG99_08030 [Ignavibacteria bacterium]|nr:hypothetical protein [Ignavibacteria bacterium]
MTLSQSLDLSGSTFPVLIFVHQLQSYYNVNNGCGYDNIYLEISTNGGFNWSQVNVWTGSNRTWTYETI